MLYSKILLVICLLVSSVTLFSKCSNSGDASAKEPRGGQYAGTLACAGCHRGIVASYSRSNHSKTSSAFNDTFPDTTMRAGHPFYFRDSSYVVIEKQHGSFYQSYFMQGIKTISNRFDIAFGSGEKAQTYASWQGEQLMQLPLSYYSGIRAWANSPGFPAGHARFERVIVSRCFECHASYIQKEVVQSGPVAVSEKLNRNAVVYGIDCERCHGPAADHVLFHKEHPTEKAPGFVVSVKSLSRQQQLDGCAVCHSGNDRETQRSLFAFRPGDTLSNFYYPDFGALHDNEPDVHGKQWQLLRMSRCFQRSELTCVTCHDPHDRAKTTAGYIAACMNCHGKSAHASAMLREAGMQGGNTEGKEGNCIGCHMPLQASKSIYFSNSTDTKNIPYYLRTHRIAVYKDSALNR